MIHTLSDRMGRPYLRPVCETYPLDMEHSICDPSPTTPPPPPGGNEDVGYEDWEL